MTDKMESSTLLHGMALAMSLASIVVTTMAVFEMKEATAVFKMHAAQAQGQHRPAMLQQTSKIPADRSEPFLPAASQRNAAPHPPAAPAGPTGAITATAVAAVAAAPPVPIMPTPLQPLPMPYGAPAASSFSVPKTAASATGTAARRQGDKIELLAHGDIPEAGKFTLLNSKESQAPEPQFKLLSKDGK